jgi:hypothetical protein
MNHAPSAIPTVRNPTAGNDAAPLITIVVAT